MRFTVGHTTRYTYTRPVFIEPITIRLRPRSDVSQRLERYEVSIVPSPDGMSHYNDEHGNDVCVAWFSGMHDELAIATAFEAVTLRRNPFDYLPTPERLPLDKPVSPALEPYRRSAGIHPEVAELAGEQAGRAGAEVVSFLSAITQRVREVCEVVSRPHGDAMESHDALSLGRGSCRDLAVLFVDLCRTQGLPARFVSGYVPPDEDTDLHAWAEVYVAGGGWRAYDPTLGLAVSDAHLAVAAGIDARHAAPVTGTFRGTHANHTLDTEVGVVVCQDGDSDPKGGHG